MDGAGSTSGGFSAGLPRKRMAAGVLLRDERGRALLVEPTYKDYWEIPGGSVEADESPLAAAHRELEEELGLSRVLGPLLAVDWVPPLGDRSEGLIVIFDGGTVSPETAADIRIPADELRGWAFCSPEEAEARLSPLLTRRLSAAVDACSTGEVAYLEDGRARP